MPGDENSTGRESRRRERPSMSIREAYDLLGLRTGAGREEVQATYRRLALKYHPDRNPGSLEQFKQLSAAYRVLQGKFHLDSGHAESLRAECDRCGEYAILHAAADGSHCCGTCLSIANRRPLLPGPPITIVTCAATIVLLVLALGCLLLSLASPGAGLYSLWALVLGVAAVLSLAVTCLTVVYTAEPKHLTARNIRRVQRVRRSSRTVHTASERTAS